MPASSREKYCMNAASKLFVCTSGQDTCDVRGRRLSPQTIDDCDGNQSGQNAPDDY